ncbi:PIG-L family deacetylase [Candidatus Woesearchaeota archaeon]|nr:PIG-L family deacetylase [Candidatus Woesearchaeota archaeon]
MGGTIPKFVQEGKNVIVVVFSFGEKSHPHYKEEVISNIRLRETKSVDRFIGRKSIFFGLTEGKIKEEAKKMHIDSRIKSIVQFFKPEKIFTLSELDPHPDHRAVHEFVVETLSNMKYKGDLYAFEVWNIVNENKPVMYVDISDTFNLKLKTMKQFRSQWLSIYLLWLPVYIRARLNGIKNNCRYAEKFYKLK